jgi:hypothetical protein
MDSHIRSALEIAPAKSQQVGVEASEGKATRKAAPIKGAASSVRSKKEWPTTVQAKIDVGFGNALFIRGQGDGLSWDQGAPLECHDPTTWVWATKKADETIEFKLLLNDEIWAQGENLTVAPGATIETVPAFN